MTGSDLHVTSTTSAKWRQVNGFGGLDEGFAAIRAAQR
jgi:hypothetical protein